MRTMMNRDEMDLWATSNSDAERAMRGKSTLAENTYRFHKCSKITISVGYFTLL